MHIVLSGYYGFDNVGDEAILYSIVQSLKKLDPEIDITVLSNNPKATESLYQINAVNRWNPAEIIRVLKQADGLISGGGSLLQDETGFKSIAYYAGIIKLAQFYNKPVFIYAQGIGPINYKINSWIVKTVLNDASMITVRDKYSQTLLKEIGITRPVTIVPDPVLGLSGSEFSSEWMKIRQLDSPVITVSVRDWPRGINFKQKIAACLDELAADGETIVFVPMHGKYDRQASEEVAGLMTNPSVILPEWAPMEEKISIIGLSRLLIGMRLHALVFAAISSTPFVAVSYDPKIDAFAELFDQPVAGHVEQDDWSGQYLAAVARQLRADGANQAEQMRKKTEQYQQQAWETPEAVLRLFQ